jgi:hypothetical protein
MKNLKKNLIALIDGLIAGLFDGYFSIGIPERLQPNHLAIKPSSHQ